MTEVQNLIEAIKLINNKRVEVAGVDAVWSKLFSAARYLDNQVKQLLSE